MYILEVNLPFGQNCDCIDTIDTNLWWHLDVNLHVPSDFCGSQYDACCIYAHLHTTCLVYRRHRTPQSVWTVSSAYLRNLKFFPKRFQRPCLCTPNGWPHRKRKSYVFSLNRLSTIVTTALNSTNVVIINGHDRFYTLYSNSNLCPKTPFKFYIGRSRQMRHFEWS